MLLCGASMTRTDRTPHCFATSKQRSAVDPGEMWHCQKLWRTITLPRAQNALRPLRAQTVPLRNFAVMHHPIDGTGRRRCSKPVCNKLSKCAVAQRAGFSRDLALQGHAKSSPNLEGSQSHLHILPSHGSHSAVTALNTNQRRNEQQQFGSEIHRSADCARKHSSIIVIAVGLEVKRSFLEQLYNAHEHRLWQ